MEHIIERCNFKFPDFKYHLPKFTNPSSKSDTQYFNDLCHDGLRDYLGSSTLDNKIYEERLEEEIRVINNMGFSSYFLIVQEFITWARKMMFQLVQVGALGWIISGFCSGYYKH